jgi:hypothetical protein
VDDFSGTCKIQIGWLHIINKLYLTAYCGDKTDTSFDCLAAQGTADVKKIIYRG